MRGTIPLILLFLYCVSAGCQSHVGSGSSRGRTSSSSNAGITFGQPRTVETGTEETPDSQGFLDCATQYLQATLRHSGTTDMIQKLQGGIALGDDAVIVGHGAPGIFVHR
jgi:hypothetical protein